YNKKIDAICTSIENTLLVYFDEEFEQAQARHHSKVRKFFSFFENVPLGSYVRKCASFRHFQLHQWKSKPTFTLSVRLEDTRVVLIRTIKKMESTIQFVVPKRATFVQWDDHKQTNK
ncbi:hypothetical protein AAMO2058_000953700, partial [Amorphochlora amoebiformis]